MTLIQIFEETVRANSSSIAVVAKERSLTYGELNFLANKLALTLIEVYCVKPDTIVGFIADNSEWAIVSVLGILKAGAAFLPIDQAYPAQRRKFMMEDAEIRLLLVTSKHYPLDDVFTREIFLVDIQLDSLQDTEDNAFKCVSKPSDLAYVIYTSGTSGFPKGVMIENRNIQNYIQWANYFYFGNSNGFHSSLFTSLSFDLTLTTLFATLLRGDKLYLFNDTLEKVLPIVFSNQNDITTVKLTPSHISLLGDLDLKSSNVQIVISGGERLTKKQVSTLRNLNSDIKIYNEYGPTETTVGSTVKLIGDIEEEILIGAPIGNTKVYILSDRETMQPVEVSGEICIAGAGIARGYVNQPELTAEKFIKNPIEKSNGKVSVVYRTGDVGYWLSRKELRLIGRKDDQVKIRGHRIELGEIESVLQSHALVDVACVVAQGSNSLQAFVVPNSESARAIRNILGINKTNQLYELPNQLLVFHRNSAETDLIYHEIFEERVYCRNGIKIADGDVILDIGANIGVATLFFGLNFPNSEIYSFEPIPEVYETLTDNVALYGLSNVKAFNYGVSNEQRDVLFKYYPGNTVLSGYYGDLSEERTNVKIYLHNEANAKKISLEQDVAEKLVLDRVKSEDVLCKLKTISDIIDEQQLTSIDLLKIDVEKSEIDVINGIGSNWRKISQIIIEVHDSNGRLDDVVAVLEDNDFEVTVEQDKLLKTSNIYNVYGIKNRSNEGVLAASMDNISGSKFRYNPQSLVNHLRDYLTGIVPSFMLPDDIFLITEIPLIVNGKVDKKALAMLAEERKAAESDYNYAKPSSELENELVKIWEEVLGRQRVGVKDKFFEIGGNSLSAIQVVNLFSKQYPNTLEVADLFTNDSIHELCKLLMEKRGNVTGASNSVFNNIEI